MPLHLLDNLTNLSNPDLARTALGSGAVGDDVFTADTEAAAHTAIGLYPISTQEFLSGSGTIALPTGARYVSFTLIGGGGGGGSGARGAANANKSGGVGGRGGGYVSILPTPVSIFTWPISYSVGVGGAGGAARELDTSAGNKGFNGTETTITSNSNIIKAISGAGSSGGSNVGNTGSGFALANVNGILGAGPLGSSSAVTASNATANSNGSTGSNIHFPSSGGPGGGISSTSTIFNGGNGTPLGTANIYVVNGGLAGVSGDELGKNGNTDSFTKAGTGGGGGRATAVTLAGNAGGNGALYGGGGGGGSASVNGQNSGAGGNGADGRIQITFWY
jgi:hypothetical protein